MSEETKNNEEKKIALTVQERMGVVAILPTEGTYERIVLVRGIKDKVVLTQAEQEEIGYTVESLRLGNGQVASQAQWDSKKADDLVFGVAFTKLERNIINESLKELSDKKKLTEAHISLYEKFSNVELGE